MHIGPIVVSDFARLGENCKIHFCVNFGANAGKCAVVPKIGNNVYIRPGAKIFGDIEIASNITIGANAVVNRSFITHGVAVCGKVPVKIISNKGVVDILKICY